MVDEVIGAWAFGSPVHWDVVSSGLINQTWRVRTHHDDLAVLQRLNTDIFVPQVHEDIEAVTAHLAISEVPTPRLIRTSSGALWHTAPDGSVWRCLTPVGTRTIHRLATGTEACSAGELVGRFHRALCDLEITFQSVRPGAHDTEAHMASLARAIAIHTDHRLFGEVGPLADDILAGWEGWRGGGGPLPLRIVHGDLKVSNIRFEGDRALAIIDLDTLAHGTLDVELGDAMRSWCNPASEDSGTPVFDVALFEAAMEGYAAGAGPDLPAEAEWRAIVPGTERICWELAARFARDALEERYFGWDPRFGSRGDHNLLRARGQARLAASVRAARDDAEAALARVR